METDEIKKLITDMLEEIADINLLDLIYKILLESTQDSPEVPNIAQI